MRTKEIHANMILFIVCMGCLNYHENLPDCGMGPNFDVSASPTFVTEFSSESVFVSTYAFCSLWRDTNLRYSTFVSQIRHSVHIFPFFPPGGFIMPALCFKILDQSLANQVFKDYIPSEIICQCLDAEGRDKWWYFAIAEFNNWFVIHKIIEVIEVIKLVIF